MGNNAYATFQSTVQTLVSLNLMPADVAATLTNVNPLSIPSGFEYLGAGYNITKAWVAIIEDLELK
ncbi:MAG TPA: hypothetical protein PLF25_10305 [Accumulibacter sp.]|nr:hypothetical protein [Accumulibacter sp.]